MENQQRSGVDNAAMKIIGIQAATPFEILHLMSVKSMRISDRQILAKHFDDSGNTTPF